MGKGATRIIVYSLAGILLSGIGAPIVQAAPQNRHDRQQQEQQRQGPQRPNPPRENSRERQDRNNHYRNNDGRRHVYNNERYRASHWRESSHIYERRQPWFWHSRDHVGRNRIIDARWDREFPGLRSYRWHGPGFWYRDIEYRDLVLFYERWKHVGVNRFLGSRQVYNDPG